MEKHALFIRLLFKNVLVFTISVICYLGAIFALTINAFSSSLCLCCKLLMVYHVTDFRLLTVTKCGN